MLDLCRFLSRFRPDHFFPGWSIIMDYGLYFSNGLNSETPINTQLLLSQIINWWIGVDYYDVFISSLDSHSDGTHSLQSIHWWASDSMLYDEETNSSTSWSTFSANRIFAWTVPLTLHPKALSLIRWASRRHSTMNTSSRIIVQVYERRMHQLQADLISGQVQSCLLIESLFMPHCCCSGGFV